MRDILDSLKEEFISIHADGKTYTVRTWHVLVAVFMFGWLVG